jgi:hypothetical protein
MNLDEIKPGAVFVWLDRYMLVGTLKQATAETFSDEFGLRAYPKNPI